MLMNEMKREHPTSPKTGAGVVKWFLFFNHRSAMKIHDRDTAIAVQEGIRIFELKTISLFT